MLLWHYIFLHILRLLTYCLVTPCGRILLEKQPGSQLRYFSTFYGTRRFITAFTSASHLSLSSTSPSPPVPFRTYIVVNLKIYKQYTCEIYDTYFHYMLLCTKLMYPDLGWQTPNCIPMPVLNAFKLIMRNSFIDTNLIHNFLYKLHKIKLI